MKAAAEICRQSCCRLSGGDHAEGIGGAEVGVAQRAQHRAHLVDRRLDARARRPAPVTTMSTESRLPNCRRQAWMGMMTVASWLWPSVRPCLASRPITR